MRFKTVIALFLLVGISANLSSCSQAALAKLEGKWQYVNFDDLTGETGRFVWTFDSGDITVDYFEAPTASNPFPPADRVNTGEYSSKTGFTKASITIFNLSDPTQIVLSNAEYQIAEIDNENMRLLTDDIGGIVIREFIRVD